MGLAWDAKRAQLLPLDGDLRCRLRDEVMQSLEPGLIDALQAAAAADVACSGSRGGESRLARRRSQFRAECAALLDRKTEVTQIHHERATELRREVMLFEAIEYLELQLANGNTAHPGTGATQIRTALHMLETAEKHAPADAVERLRERLDRLQVCLL